MFPIYMILDESGSMAPLVNDTIGGFNQFLREQQAVDDRSEGAVLHLACFSSSGIRRPIWGRSIREVHPLTTKDYRPGGGTPLLDAVGEIVSNASGSRGLIVVATDGEENESRRFTKSQVKELITSKQAAGWTVLFFGANIDAFAEAMSIGIRGQTATWYGHTAAGTSGLYAAASMTSSHLRGGGSGQSLTLNTTDDGVPTVEIDQTTTSAV